MNALHPVQVIAVVGGSGAGKGWFVDRLCLRAELPGLLANHEYRN